MTKITKSALEAIRLLGMERSPTAVGKEKQAMRIDGVTFSASTVRSLREKGLLRKEILGLTAYGVHVFRRTQHGITPDFFPDKKMRRLIKLAAERLPGAKLHDGRIAVAPRDVGCVYRLIKHGLMRACDDEVAGRPTVQLTPGGELEAEYLGASRLGAKK